MPRANNRQQSGNGKARGCPAQWDKTLEIICKCVKCDITNWKQFLDVLNQIENKLLI